MTMGKYLCEYCPGHPKATKEGYVYSHILAAEKKLGRYLNSEECVHHIDEDKYNNSLSNLIVFKTRADHAGYHKGCSIRQLGDVYVADIGEKTTCPLCGNKKDYKAKVCIDCRGKYYNKEIEFNHKINRQKLKELIYAQSFVQIGKLYGVTDNAIRKWCDKYNLPRKSSEIKKYSPEEWVLI